MGGKFGATALAFGAAVAVLVAGSTAAYGGSRGARTPSAPIYRVAARERVVALSFDDGPDPRWTPTVLDILARYQAHATFFDLGRTAVRNPDLVARELAAGHEVGDHTWSHPHLPRLSASSAASEIAAGNTALSSLTGREMRLFRPPYGQTTDTINAVAAKQGMRTVLWGACLERYVRRDGVPKGVRELIANVQPGSIILAHDGGVPNRSRTMTALPALLRALAAARYRVVTVGELLRAAS